MHHHICLMVSHAKHSVLEVVLGCFCGAQLQTHQEFSTSFQPGSWLAP